MRTTYLSDDSDEEDVYLADRKYKILVLGDKAVGKTSFITRLTKGYYSMFYTPTVGIEIYNEVQIGDICVSFWDVPEHIRYHFKLKSLNAGAVVLMFDTKNIESKKNVVRRWIDMSRCLKTLPYVFVVGVRKNRDTELEESIYYIDNMSTEGYHELLYAIQRTIVNYK